MQSTNQEGEFSCGWVNLPLFQQDGVPAQNKFVPYLHQDFTASHNKTYRDNDGSVFA